LTEWGSEITTGKGGDQSPVGGGGRTGSKKRSITERREKKKVLRTTLPKRCVKKDITDGQTASLGGDRQALSEEKRSHVEGRGENPLSWETKQKESRSPH